MDSDAAEARSFVGYRQRCVLLSRPGGLGELVETLTQKGFELRRCDSIYLAMAELVLHEAARRSGWHADAAQLVIAEPDKVRDLSKLIRAVQKWAPQTNIQTYSSKQEPRLQPYEAGLAIDETPAPHEPATALPRKPEVVVRPRPASTSSSSVPAKLRLAGDGSERQRTVQEVPVTRREGTPIHAPAASDESNEGNAGDTLIISEAELSMLLSPQWKFSKPGPKS